MNKKKMITMFQSLISQKKEEISELIENIFFLFSNRK